MKICNYFDSSTEESDGCPMHNTEAQCGVEIQLYKLTSALHIVSFTAWSFCTRGNGAKDGPHTLSHYYCLP